MGTQVTDTASKLELFSRDVSSLKEKCKHFEKLLTEYRHKQRGGLSIAAVTFSGLRETMERMATQLNEFAKLDSNATIGEAMAGFGVCVSNICEQSKVSVCQPC